MDWSLVLLSQGIESVLERTEDGWGLVVEADQWGKAEESIVLYRRENRGTLWRQQFAGNEVRFAWIAALVWSGFLASIYWLSHVAAAWIGAAGILDSVAVSKGAWWRLFTATMLHSDVAHLTANLVSGFLFLGLAMGRFGVVWTLLVTILAGATGNLAGLIFHTEPYRGLGASGAVMGALGMLAANILLLKHGSPMAVKSATATLLGALMLFVLVGADPASDTAAHAGGFVFGILCGVLLAGARPNFLRARSGHVLASVLCVCAILVPWLFALR